MARHRWATGTTASVPDRLNRLFAVDAGGTLPQLPAPQEHGEEPAPELFTAQLRADQQGTPGRRWAATRRAALMAAGSALAVGGWLFLTADRDEVEVVPLAPPATGSAATSSATDVSSGGTGSEDGRRSPGEADRQENETANGGTVVVHVAGAVGEPGVVEAPAGARVFEVLDLAGGSLPDAELSAVNLAGTVQDGQQIIVPRVGEPVLGAQNAVTPGSPGEGTSATLIDLNLADAAQLEELPRVGPVLAERIVQWRTQHGPFAHPEDLDAVPGIGPAMLESLLPLVTV